MASWITGSTQEFAVDPIVQSITILGDAIGNSDQITTDLENIHSVKNAVALSIEAPFTTITGDLEVIPGNINNDGIFNGSTINAYNGSFSNLYVSSFTAESFTAVSTFEQYQSSINITTSSLTTMNLFADSSFLNYISTGSLTGSNLSTIGFQAGASAVSSLTANNLSTIGLQAGASAVSSLTANNLSTIGLQAGASAVSSLTANNLSTIGLQAAQATISSINGFPVPSVRNFAFSSGNTSSVVASWSGAGAQTILQARFTPSYNASPNYLTATLPLQVTQTTGNTHDQLTWALQFSDNGSTWTQVGQSLFTSYPYNANELIGMPLTFQGFVGATTSNQIKYLRLLATSAQSYAYTNNTPSVKLQGIVQQIL